MKRVPHGHELRWLPTGCSGTPKPCDSNREHGGEGAAGCESRAAWPGATRTVTTVPVCKKCSILTTCSVPRQWCSAQLCVHYAVQRLHPFSWPPAILTATSMSTKSTPLQANCLISPLHRSWFQFYSSSTPFLFRLNEPLFPLCSAAAGALPIQPLLVQAGQNLKSTPGPMGTTGVCVQQSVGLCSWAVTRICAAVGVGPAAARQQDWCRAYQACAMNCCAVYRCFAAS
jgi:hypothetical protein